MIFRTTAIVTVINTLKLMNPAKKDALTAIIGLISALRFRVTQYSQE